MRTLLALFLTLNLTACGNGEEAETPDAAIDANTSIDAGADTAQEIVCNMLEGDTAVTVANYTVHPNSFVDYDFIVQPCGPSLPCLALGTDVTAADLGNDDGFHDVTTAPATGYETTPLESWRTGTAPTWDMTGNIFVLKLADSTYAKLEVLSASSGVFHILLYHQPNGTTDITTTAE